MRILVTAFEPFGNYSVNPTQEIVKKLPAKIGKAKIHTQILPVSFAQTFGVLQKKLQEHVFDYIIMMGLNGSVAHILLEMTAHNHTCAQHTDNDGNVPQAEYILRDAPLSYNTQVPYWELLAHLQAKDFPVRASSSAGTYVCNHTYYQCLHYIETHFLPSKCLFVHVPATSDMGLEKGMALETEYACMQALIDYLASHSKILKPLL